MFDHHVHITGSLFCRDYHDLKTIIKVVSKKLKKSLRENNIDGFIGIVTSGTFYKDPMNFDKAFSLNVDILFDNDGKGLNLVKRLGGVPAVLLFPEFIMHNLKRYDFILRRSKN